MKAALNKKVVAADSKSAAWAVAATIAAAVAATTGIINLHRYKNLCQLKSFQQWKDFFMSTGQPYMFGEVGLPIANYFLCTQLYNETPVASHASAPTILL